MTVIYTTQRTFIVKEHYEYFISILKNNDILELTEVITNYFDPHELTPTVSERKVLLNKKYFIEAINAKKDDKTKPTTQ